MKHKIGFALLTSGLLFVVSQSCTHKFTSECELVRGCEEDGPGAAGSTTGPGGGGSGSYACDALCDGATPYCDEESRECVACRDNVDCTDASAPRCEAGQCLGCTEAADCAHHADQGVCDPESGSCVECMEATDCAQHPDGSLCVGGQCVECTVEDESACGDNSCDPATNTCTSTKRSSRGPCQTCVADSECEPDHRCVPMEFQGEVRERGYCLKVGETGCVRPFGVPTPERSSLSGAASEKYCGIDESRTTCEAVRDLIDDKDCTMPDDCGVPGLDDARCETVNLTDNKCTYSCNLNSQCPMTLNCGSSPNDYCGYVP